MLSTSPAIPTDGRSKVAVVDFGQQGLCRLQQIVRVHVPAMTCRDRSLDPYA
jgi:hypothetical protein